MDATTAFVVLGCVFAVVVGVAICRKAYVKAGGNVGSSSFFIEAADRRRPRR